MKKWVVLVITLGFAVYCMAQKNPGKPSKRERFLTWLQSHEKELTYKIADTLGKTVSIHKFKFFTDRIVENKTFRDLENGVSHFDTIDWYFFHALRPDVLRHDFQPEDLDHHSDTIAKMGYIGIPCKPVEVVDLDEVNSDAKNGTITYAIAYLEFAYPLNDLKAKARVLTIVEKLRLYLKAVFDD